MWSRNLEHTLLDETRFGVTHHNARYTPAVNSAPKDSPVAGIDESHATWTTLGWRLSFWTVIATILIIQIVGVAAFLSYRGVFYNTFHGFPMMILRIGGKVAAALAVRFVLHRWYENSTTSRSLSDRQNFTALGLETIAIVFVLSLTAYAYSWPKVMIPILNPRLWDVVLAKIDTVLCFGVNPNEFFLTIFEGAPLMVNQMLDRYYSLFVLSQGIVSAWFVTEPRANRRIAFGGALILLWVLGVWSYVAMPALGPVYVFEEYSQRVATIFPSNAAAQAALLTNYDGVHRIIAGREAMIVPHLGIAAMPSLHVAVHFFLYLWACFIGSRLRLLLLAMTTLTLIASMVLCWHYLIDGLAGIALAGAVFGIGVLINRVLDARGASQPQSTVESLR